MSRQLQSSDGVDERQAQWAYELSDVDTRGMATLGRMRLITTIVRPPIEQVFKCHDLDSGEFDVLATLLRSGAPYQLRPTELFRSLMISSGGLTDRLNRLNRMSLITRTPSPDDGRSMMVELTAEGRRRAENAFRLDMALEASLLGGLNEAEQSQLANILRKLLLSLENNQTSEQHVLAG